MSDDVGQAATWQDVAPLLARWAIGVGPSGDGTWEVIRLRPGTCGEAWEVETIGVLFSALPQAIADVAAQCEASEKGEG